MGCQCGKATNVEAVASLSILGLASAEAPKPGTAKAVPGDVIQKKARLLRYERWGWTFGSLYFSAVACFAYMDHNMDLFRT